MPQKKTYRVGMSALVEVIAAVVQGLLESLGDLLVHRDSGDHEDELPVIVGAIPPHLKPLKGIGPTRVST